MKLSTKLLLLLGSLIITTKILWAEKILIQSTTSTQNSGFFEYILPIIKKATGITANVIAVGTGAAIKNAERCNGDMLIVHAKNREEAFVRAGFGVLRKNLMYNDFVVVGPKSDPANIKTSKNINEALIRIAHGNHRFISRGDDSGTHIKELKLWMGTQINPQDFSGSWYLETGSGMGSTLNVGVELNSYVFTDRASWISFKNKQDFKVLFQGDDSLFNQYGIIPISPENCPKTKIKEATKIIDWLTSARGKQIIRSFRLNGHQLFFTQ